MTVFLTFLAILGACALLLGLFIVAVAWSASRLDRAENAASGFQRDEPYTDKYAREADRWPASDFEQAGFDRLQADIDQARAEAADPTSPTRLRHIPAQRKEQP